MLSEVKKKKKKQINITQTEKDNILWIQQSLVLEGQSDNALLFKEIFQLYHG
jgi:hypothetical protein